MAHQRRRPLDALTAPLPDTKGIIHQDSNSDIEEDISEADAIIPPPVLPRNGHLSQKLVRGRQGAVLAHVGGGGVDDAAAGDGGVGREVVPARAAGGGSEAGEFVGGAGDGPGVQACCGEGLDEVGQGRDAVHEEPKAWEGGRRLHHACWGGNICFSLGSLEWG